MITTARRVEYARGYLDLGLFAQAAHELTLIRCEDERAIEVMEVRIELHTAAKQWDLAAAAAEQVVLAKPDGPEGWISWAYATRRCRDIPSAELILLDAEKRLGASCSMIHYNLACYRCQQGDLEGAKERLATAFRIEPLAKAAALNDSDLLALQDYIRSME